MQWCSEGGRDAVPLEKHRENAFPPYRFFSVPAMTGGRCLFQRSIFYLHSVFFISYDKMVLFQGRPQDLAGEGGGEDIFFFRFLNLHVASLGGFGGMFPQENIFKWCNLVRFGEYLDQILSLKFF